MISGLYNIAYTLAEAGNNSDWEFIAVGGISALVAGIAVAVVSKSTNPSTKEIQEVKTGAYVNGRADGIEEGMKIYRTAAQNEFIAGDLKVHKGKKNSPCIVTSPETFLNNVDARAGLDS